MERKIDDFLLKWKNDILRRPLIIYGPHQVGKTYSIIDFGKKNYKNIVYFDAYKNYELERIFQNSRSIEKIINQLGVLSLDTIIEEDTLIIIDNLDSLEIIKGLKTISTNKISYHFICITNHTSNISKFKGEELNFKKMITLDFEEYLWAIGERALGTTIKESFSKIKKCSFHKLALEYFNDYIITGGFPEVINAKINNANKYEQDSIKSKIIDIYKREFLNIEKITDAKRAELALDSIPNQLLKENKKFRYDIAESKSRKSDYVNAINKLLEIEIVKISRKLKDVASPLSKYKEEDNFRLYLSDTGILFTMMKLTYRKYYVSEELKKIIYENYTALTLSNAGYALYYYYTDFGTGQIDFVIQNKMGQIIPIEIYMKENGRSKAMPMFIKKYATTRAYRISEDNFLIKKEIRCIPIYSIFSFIQ